MIWSGLKQYPRQRTEGKQLETYHRVRNAYDFHFVEQMSHQALLELQVSDLCRNLYTRVNQSIQQYTDFIQIHTAAYLPTPVLPISIVYFIKSGTYIRQNRKTVDIRQNSTKQQTTLVGIICKIKFRRTMEGFLCFIS